MLWIEILLQELESLEDPTKKEVAEIRKKIEAVDRELRPMKQICEKKVIQESVHAMTY